MIVESAVTSCVSGRSTGPGLRPCVNLASVIQKSCDLGSHI